LPGELAPYGLNNGFGADPSTERAITWLAPDSANYTAPRVAAAAAGPDPAVQIEANCSTTPLPSPMAAYTAYTCKFAGLTPGTRYDYVLTATQGGQVRESAIFSFTTAPRAAESFTFLDFADSQSDTNAYASFWGNTLRTAIDRHPEAVFATHTGDLVDSMSTSHLQGWLNAVGTSLQSIAFNPVLGNHDDGNADVARVWSGIFDRASLTTPPTSSDPWPLQYSMVYANALFLFVNTNLDSDSQLDRTSAWVKETVAAHAKNPDGSNRFVIAVEHKSPFGGRHSGTGSYPTGDGGNPQIVAELPRTYYEAGVDLVLAGHDHNLIRSLPITWDYASGRAAWNRNQASLTTVNSASDGLVYYVPRNSGQKTYQAVTPSSTSRPWIAWAWQQSDYGQVQPGNTVYATVTVSASELRIKSYRTGDPATPVDQFSVVQPAAESMTLGQETWNAPAAASSLSIPVDASVAWSASENSAWLTAAKSPDGRSLTLAVTANTSSAARTATVTVNGPGISRTVAVAQAAPGLNLGLSAWAAPTLGGSTQVAVTSNVAWTVATPSWVTATPTSGTGDGVVTLTAAAKTSSSSRSGSVTFRGSGVSSRTTSVTQAASVLTAGQTSWDALVVGGSTSIPVTSNISWGASSSAAWLRVTPSSGAGNGAITLAAEAKTTSARRTATVRLTGGGVTRSINVTQAANTLQASPTSWDAPPIGGERVIAVSSNVAWTATSNQAWLTVSNASGLGSGSLTLAAQSKPTSAARSATVTLAGGGVTRTISVTQAATRLTLGRGTWDAPSREASSTFTVTSNVAWTLISDQPWLTVSTAGATGTASVTIRAAYAGVTRPTATLTFTGGGVTRTLQVRN
jgi:hypothetical protein